MVNETNTEIQPTCCLGNNVTSIQQLVIPQSKRLYFSLQVLSGFCKFPSATFGDRGSLQKVWVYSKTKSAQGQEKNIYTLRIQLCTTINGVPECRKVSAFLDQFYFSPFQNRSAIILLQSSECLIRNLCAQGLRFCLPTCRQSRRWNQY